MYLLFHFFIQFLFLFDLISVILFIFSLIFHYNELIYIFFTWMIHSNLTNLTWKYQNFVKMFMMTFYFILFHSLLLRFFKSNNSNSIELSLIRTIFTFYLVEFFSEFQLDFYLIYFNYDDLSHDNIHFII